MRRFILCMVLVLFAGCQTTEQTSWLDVYDMECAFKLWQSTPKPRSMEVTTLTVPTFAPWFEVNIPNEKIGEHYSAEYLASRGHNPDETFLDIADKALDVWAVTTNEAVVTTLRWRIDTLYPHLRVRHPTIKFTPGVKLHSYVQDAGNDPNWFTNRSLWDYVATDAVRACSITGDDRFYLMMETPMGDYWDGDPAIYYDRIWEAMTSLRATGIKFCFYPLYIVNDEHDEEWSALIAAVAAAVPGSYSSESYETWKIGDYEERKDLHYRIMPPTDQRIIMTLEGVWHGPSYSKNCYNVQTAKEWMQQHSLSGRVLLWGGLTNEYLNALGMFMDQLRRML